MYTAIYVYIYVSKHIYISPNVYNYICIYTSLNVKRYFILGLQTLLIYFIPGELWQIVLTNIEINLLHIYV